MWLKYLENRFTQFWLIDVCKSLLSRTKKNKTILLAQIVAETSSLYDGNNFSPEHELYIAKRHFYTSIVGITLFLFLN